MAPTSAQTDVIPTNLKVPTPQNRLMMIEAILWVIKKIIKRWPIDGPWKTISHLIRQPRTRILDPYIIEPYHDWRMGIQTQKVVSANALGLPGDGCHHYVPAGYRDFQRAMKYLTIVPNQDVFLDYGSGMGRVLVMAGKYPFKRIIGVEFSPELNEIAEQNINRARRKLKCQAIELVTADTTRHSLSNDVTVIYMFNPFQDQVLIETMHRIHESLLASPRKLTLIYRNPLYFEPIADQFPWIVKRDEFYYYYDYKYAIYDCVV